MKYFDLHCDTLPIVMHKRKSLVNSGMMVDLADHPFEKYTQVLAVFSYPSLSADDAYDTFWKCRTHLDVLSDLPENFSCILAVENGSLIGDQPQRVEALAGAGVKLMNPVWAGDNLIGGAWNTTNGLTALGREIVCRAFDNGITPDLSHASDKMAKEILKIAEQKGKPVIASHSCARSLQNLGRNLPDEYFREIARSGGIVGLSFCPPHLSDGECNMETIRRHLEHYLSLDGEDVIAIGADWDGIDTTPDGVATIRDIPALTDYLRSCGWPEELLHKLFYQNAADFFARQNIPF